MNREQALEEVQKRISSKNLIKHSLAVEAIMRELAEHFGQDLEKWGLAGLLHDIDYENTAEDPARHSLEGAEILKGLGIEE
jgi:putative nucleotidyltransferase with HDIG domain